MSVYGMTSVTVGAGDIESEECLLSGSDDGPGKRLTGRMRPGKLGVNLFSYTASELDANGKLLELTEGN